MKVSNVLMGLAVLGTISFQAMAQDKRVHCAKPNVEVPQFATVEDYQAVLFQKGVVLATPVTDTKFLDTFLAEEEKFPESLRQDMIKAGSRIHLIEGLGVIDDPSWKSDAKSANNPDDPFWNQTFDGRDWSKVPGAGGSTYTKLKVPTRIVVNHLYDHHGSVNLFLHEHAHSLDALYKADTISKSTPWKDLMASQPEKIPQFLSTICGDYCVNNHQEGFAELFAYYHACEESRAHMESSVPEVADYLRDLTSMEEFKPLEPVKTPVVVSSEKKDFPKLPKLPKMPDLSDEVKAVKKGFSWLKSKVTKAVDDIL